jgi:hypothetical protein
MIKMKKKEQQQQQNQRSHMENLFQIYFKKKSKFQMNRKKAKIEGIREKRRS